MEATRGWLKDVVVLGRSSMIICVFQAEIFSTASAGVRKGGRKERKLLKREKFLKKMAHPKRECVKAVTDGISLSYHAQIVRSALDKPG